MLEVSSGQLLVLSVAGVIILGKRDLPRLSRVIGTQLGRVVGLAQGARARADSFAAENELRQVQAELRSGLRQLNAVKAEVELSVSSGRNVAGRSNGQSSETILESSSQKVMAVESRRSSALSPDNRTDKPEGVKYAGKQETLAAAAEYEWERRGLVLSTRADVNESTFPNSGSKQLAGLIQESLLFSEYDRLTGSLAANNSSAPSPPNTETHDTKRLGLQEKNYGPKDEAEVDDSFGPDGVKTNNEIRPNRVP